MTRVSPTPPSGGQPHKIEGKHQYAAMQERAAVDKKITSQRVPTDYTSRSFLERVKQGTIKKATPMKTSTKGVGDFLSGKTTNPKGLFDSLHNARF